MDKIQKILVPTDFSSCSEAATKAALVLARRFEAELTLLHVVEMTAGAEETFYPPVDLVGAVESEALDALNQACRRIEGTVTVHTAIRRGSPWVQVLETAEVLGADLIVMGTHGRTGFFRALIGSTTEKVVRTSKVAVLTVHAAEEERGVAGAR